MGKLKAKDKALLSMLLGEGHAKFGVVTPRRPYKEDDESGGDDGSAKFLPDHPLFMEQPIGASSDLTFIANQNSNSLDQAEERSDQASPELKKSLDNVLNMGKRARHVATPNPFHRS
ncbi:MAG: hypothetical protein JXR42_01280 [Gammaproteobacteria bacterium]|nr:hypothetical protein [Gammaproteobacteria bacterium]